MQQSRIDALTIPALIRAAADRWPDRDLLVFDDKRLSYSAAQQHSRALAAQLLRAGVGKGSHVGLLCPNSPEYVISLLAVMRIGAAAVPISTFSTVPELRQMIRHADISDLILVDRYLNHDYVAKLEEAFPRLVEGNPFTLSRAPYWRRAWVWSSVVPVWAQPVGASDGDADTLLEAAEMQVSAADVGAIIYTSGSTGEPKGVVHSQGNLLRQSVKQARDNDYRQGDRIFSSMPFFWVGGLTYKLLPAMQSGAAILGCQSGAAADMLDFIERERATLFLGWPYSTKALLGDPSFARRDLSSLRGGNLYAALPPEQRPDDPTLVISGLGMTETAGPHTAGQRCWVEPSLRGSVGWAADNMEHRIVDHHSGKDLPDGEMGELWVRGDTLMLGLYKRDKDDVFEADGWYRTRDLVIRREGHFFFEGRLDDMVKIRGANVSPREVELALMEMDGVVHACVTGVEDGGQSRLGAVLVTLDQGPTLDDVRQFLRERLSAYKVPSLVRVLPASQLPMRSSGKIDRRALIAVLDESVRETKLT